MESVSRFIEKKLRLEVNREKSAAGRPWERKYLGFCLTNSRKNPKIRIHWKTIKRFKQRVRDHSLLYFFNSIATLTGRDSFQFSIFYNGRFSGTALDASVCKRNVSHLLINIVLW